MGSSGMRRRNLSGEIHSMERGMPGRGMSGDIERGVSGGMSRSMSGGMDRGFTIGMNKESSIRTMDNESGRGMSGTGNSFGGSGGMSSGFGRMRAADSFGTSMRDFGSSSNSQMQRNTGIDMDFRNKRG